jgi:hypothetical protein
VLIALATLTVMVVALHLRVPIAMSLVLWWLIYLTVHAITG